LASRSGENQNVRTTIYDADVLIPSLLRKHLDDLDQPSVALAAAENSRLRFFPAGGGQIGGGYRPRLFREARRRIGRF